MKCVRVTYRRTKNLGNYESKTIEATVELGDDDKYEWAVEWLHERVCDSLGIKVDWNDPQQPELHATREVSEGDEPLGEEDLPH